MILRTAIITSDRDLANELNRALRACPEIVSVRVLEYEADERRMAGMIRTAAPRLIFLGIEAAEQAIAAAELLRSQFPGVVVVAFGRQGEYQKLGSVMEAGLEEYLGQAFEASCVRACVDNCLDRIQPRTEHFYSFLPSKADVEASTLTIHTAMAFARENGPALLADFDLAGGMVRFRFNLSNLNSVVNAAEHAFDMDDSRWRQLVTPVGKLDVLHAGGFDPEFHPKAADVQQLANYVRSRYKTVCVDLPPAIDELSLEIMDASKIVFLVCTPDSSSLQLAKEKLLYLRRLGLAGKVRILLNGYSEKTQFTPEDVEEMVGAPVAGTFFANQEEPGIGHRTLAGRQCEALAESLLKDGSTPTQPWNTAQLAGSQLQASA